MRILFRHITLLLSLLCGIAAWGQDFNPSDPAEPGVPPSKLEVVVVPADAGSVSGTGRYVSGTKVNLYAHANTGFRFINWTDSEGKELSTSTSMTFIKGEGTERLTANYVFDPNAPDDPASVLYYRLTLTATEGGTVSGGGRYQAGQQVTLRANANSGFDFEGWYDTAGNKLSSNMTFTYTTSDEDQTIEGRFIFNPNSPEEPIAEDTRTITVTATDGGTVYLSSKRAVVGSTISISANTNTGYIFQGWYLNDEFYTDKQSFSYTVTEEQNQHFEARFVFSPNSPEEPSTPSGKTKDYAFYLMNKVTKPGDVARFPVFLSNIEPLTDITFQLSFASELKHDLGSIEVSPRAVGYQTRHQAVNDTTYIFSLTGGQLPAGNAAIVTISVPIPEDIATAKGYPVKINQVSLTGVDGSTRTASTRNGRISVYKLGDSNGDDDINVADLAGVACFMLDTPEDYLVYYAADMDGNTVVEERDFDILVDSILCLDDVTPPSTVRLHRKAPDHNETLSRLEIDNVVYKSPGVSVIKIPICLVNLNKIAGFQFDMRLGDNTEIATDENGDFVIELAPSSPAGHLLKYQLKASDGHLRLICSSKSNSLFADDSNEVIYVVLKVRGNIDTYNIKLENIVMTDARAVSYFPDDITAQIVVKEKTTKRGDVNGDDVVDIADVVAVINVILGKNSNDGADVNGDGKVDQKDAEAILEIMADPSLMIPGS